jgi:hypothetical protein
LYDLAIKRVATNAAIIFMAVCMSAYCREQAKNV